MKKLIALDVPFSISVFIFYIIATIPDIMLGISLSYPQFHSFYPFPTEICNPECGQLLIGVIGCVLYWLSAYYVYFRLLKKNDYSIAHAVKFSFLIGVVSYALHFISIISTIFVPKHSLRPSE